MSSKYSVLQYLPDPLADERINIGIVAWDQSSVRVRFLRDWKRVQCFGGDQNTTFIKQVCDRFVMEASRSKGDDTEGAPKWLKNALESWEHCLQFTAPRGSLVDADAFMTAMTPTFLKEPDEAPEAMRDARRDRRKAVRIAAAAVREVVESVIPEMANEVVSTRAAVQGKHERHEFDVVLNANDPSAAMSALSFEVGTEKALGRQVDATAWLIEDVKRGRPKFPVGVFLIPPLALSASYERAKLLFPQLKAEIVMEDKLPVWARTQAEVIAARM
jgi:hypothetical protein